jgi:hypothetical protein
MRGKVIDVMIFKDQLSFLGAIESVDAVEDAGFPGSIGPDDCEHLSLADIKTYP